ncbi:hypothetical protein L195_g024330 [Trifolium pratense]|uniref:DUF7054 domain-containing protein n=1 Tax=Trifolium pratense TaxID=57577 RepID=A0A2K3NDE6_TRIPR|nr:hypothetical protein L195_g024330 [Trifolium pratense]
MLMSNQKKNVKRLLININVLGSAGPIRCFVVINIALKSYAREGSLPILGTNITSFALYCPHVGS